MNDSNTEPVEISTRMRPGEWTNESLMELVNSYRNKLWGMGAAEDEVVTAVETPEDGSATINVFWRRSGTHTFAATGQTLTEESDVSRGHGETIPTDESTKDSKGLGAVLGDAERSPIDGPPTSRAVAAEAEEPALDFIVYTGEDGKSYVEDAGPAKE